MSKQKRVTIPIPHEVLRKSESMEGFEDAMSGRNIISDLTKRIEELEQEVKFLKSNQEVVKRVGTIWESVFGNEGGLINNDGTPMFEL